MAADQARQILDLVLHPVRMRVLMALAGSSGLTPQQIADQIGDVPQATLYRHINRLARASILTVVEERPVRGTLEKVYALNELAGSHLSQDDLAALSKEDHLRYFLSFIFSVLDDYARYLDRSAHPDLVADGVGYHRLVLFMDDAELATAAQAIQRALAPYADPGGAPGRKKRLLSTIMMPEIGSEREGSER